MVHPQAPAVTLTAWSMAELRARAKAQSRTIVAAHYSHLSGWTARTEPAREALSRTYAVSERDPHSGAHWTGTVTLSQQSGVLTGAIDGVPCPFGQAATRLDTCTTLRLIDEQQRPPVMRRAPVVAARGAA